MGTPWNRHCAQQPRDDREPVRASRSTDTRRLLVLLAVAAAHTGLLVLFTQETGRRARGEVSDYEPAMVWLTPLLDTRVEPAPATARPSPRTARARTGASRAKSPAVRSASAQMQVPSTAPHDAAADESSPPIDWQAAMDAAAAHQLARADEERSQSAIFAVPTAPASLAVPQAHGVPFRWDYAATHRIEFTPQGALYINLNDRCLYMFPIFLLCRFGEIPSHGDLLQHAKDAPAARAP